MTVTLEMISIILLAVVCVVMLNGIGRMRRQINSLGYAMHAQNEALKAIASSIYGQAMMEQYTTETEVPEDETTH